MQDIKYNQGFSDALACTSSIITTMLQEVEDVIKKKQYKNILPIITTSVISISEIWNEVNARNVMYIEKLAKKYNIEYNRDTQELVVNEDEQTIKTEERSNV